jgi:hypothetical protein
MKRIDEENQNRMTNKINSTKSASTSKFMNTNDHRLFQETNLALEKSNKQTSEYFRLH